MRKHNWTTIDSTAYGEKLAPQPRSPTHAPAIRGCIHQTSPVEDRLKARGKPQKADRHPALSARVKSTYPAPAFGRHAPHPASQNENWVLVHVRLHPPISPPSQLAHGAFPLLPPRLGAGALHSWDVLSSSAAQLPGRHLRSQNFLQAPVPRVQTSRCCT
jgi:hypothetical protein